MPFLGQQPTEVYKSTAKQTITGDGSTSYTLDNAVTSGTDLEVFVNNVRQEPGTDYSASGNTITFTTAVESSDSCWLVYQGKAFTTTSIESDNLANGSVTMDKLATSGTLPALDGSALTGIEGLPDAIDVNASAPADSLNINSSGNVGIGTSSPADKLHIYGGNLRLQGTSDGAYAQLYASGGSLFLDSDAANTGGSSAMYFGVDGDVKMRINDGGDLLIGTHLTTSSEKLKVYSGGNGCYFQSASGGGEAVSVHRSGANGTFVNFINANGSSCGNINNASGINNVTYSTSSDYRLKENVVDMTGAIDRIKTLQPKRFSWIEQEADSANTDGFLAHEVSSIIPEAVTGTKDAVKVWEEWDELPEGVSVGDNKTDEDGNSIPIYQGIDLAKLTPLLTGALQEAIAKIEALETRIETLENA